MITVTFKTSGDLICGFTVSGHSDYGEEGSDIVCAAVSSVVIMTANTVTEIMHINAKVTESDGFVNMDLSKPDAERSKYILDGLRLHLTALSEQYSNDIKVKITEV